VSLSTGIEKNEPQAWAMAEPTDSAAVEPSASEPAGASSPTSDARPTVKSLPKLAAPTQRIAAAAPPDPRPADWRTDLPNGTRREQPGYLSVPLFYATDRAGAADEWGYRILNGGIWLFLGTLFSALAAVLAIAMHARHRRGWAALSLLSSLLWFSCMMLAIQRGLTAIEHQGVSYGGARGSLVRGICQVTIPESHEVGVLESPKFWRLELAPDVQKHVVLRETRELPPTTFYQQLAESVRSSRERDILVFVHGYNVTFEHAARRAAQLSADLPFDGVPILFSWPSQGRLLAYPIDQANASWAARDLQAFLLELAAYSGARSINIVAHSMGTLVTAEAMAAIERDRIHRTRLIDQIVLAAPDIDADQFRRDYAESLTSGARRVTLYASSQDFALAASKRFNGHPRAGDSGPGLMVVEGIETVDVSGTDLSLLGHGYVGESVPVLVDLYHAMRLRQTPAERPWLMRKEKTGTLEYWQLSARLAAAAAERRAPH
jgi:esterase/lipase superfamily enzyme